MWNFPPFLNGSVYRHKTWDFLYTIILIYYLNVIFKYNKSTQNTNLHKTDTWRGLNLLSSDFPSKT